jgi:mannosyl-3-phosphoglycerate phosphatase
VSRETSIHPDTLPFVILTDLDGTLLDHDTYDWGPARPALERCRQRNVPVIAVTSKTRAEMDVLRRNLSMSAPFITENGGGIFFPRESGPLPPSEALAEGNLLKWPLGPPYRDVVHALRQIRRQLGWNILGFADMSLEEISGRTGMDRDSARLASLREFDEPFVVISPSFPDDGALSKAASERGLAVSIGGRFRHLHGTSDKGAAVERLLSRYREVRPGLVSVALGDSPNDFPMLERAGVPVLVRSARSDSDLWKRIPRLRVTRLTGPAGWNEAVLEILAEQEKTVDA